MSTSRRQALLNRLKHGQSSSVTAEWVPSSSTLIPMLPIWVANCANWRRRLLPENVRSRMRGKSGSEGIEKGMTIARELVEAAKRPGVIGY